MKPKDYYGLHHWSPDTTQQQQQAQQAQQQQQDDGSAEGSSSGAAAGPPDEGRDDEPDYEELLSQLPGLQQQLKLEAEERAGLPPRGIEPWEKPWWLPAYNEKRYMRKPEPQLTEWDLRAKMEKRKRQLAEWEGATAVPRALGGTRRICPSGFTIALPVPSNRSLPILPSAHVNLAHLNPLQHGTSGGRWSGSTRRWAPIGAPTCGARIRATQPTRSTASGATVKFGTSSRRAATTPTRAMWSCGCATRWKLRVRQTGVVGWESGGERRPWEQTQGAPSLAARDGSTAPAAAPCPARLVACAAMHSPAQSTPGFG